MEPAMIPDHELAEMNRMIEHGKTISAVNAKFPQYEYAEIYSSVEDYSLLGKKRSISNRLKRIREEELSQSQLVEIADEIQEALDSIYEVSKRNGEKLSEIANLIIG
jgi:hypothetical protein